jgi:hypothetical protein
MHQEVSMSVPVTGSIWPSPQGLGTCLNLRSGRGFIALLEAFRMTGGIAPGDVVGGLLEDHQAGDSVSLAKLIFTGQAFGFDWRENLWIPMFQFNADDLALKVGAQSVRAALPALWSGWLVAAWFAAPNALLEGRRPADMLDSDLETVTRAARSLASVDEIGVECVRRGHEVAAHM